MNRILKLIEDRLTLGIKQPSLNEKKPRGIHQPGRDSVDYELRRSLFWIRDFAFLAVSRSAGVARSMKNRE